jgi:PAS domain S-box-containing protein
VLFDDENKPVEYQGIGRDNTEKREAAARINQYIKDMEFLSRKAQEFVDLSPDIDIFQAIGEGLHELLPKAAIVINSYDAASDSLTVRAVFSEHDRKNLIACLGRDMQGFRFPLASVPGQLRTMAFSKLQTGRVFKIEEGIYDICFQQIPVDVCHRIEETLCAKDGYYGIGLCRHGIFFGNVTIALHDGEKLTNTSLVETFMHQVSVALHRRITEAALQESEFRYRGIVDDQTELITRFLPDGTLTFVNNSVCRFFQKERHELLGRTIVSLILEEDHERVIQEIRALNSDNPVHTIEHRVLDPSGNIRWFQWTNRILPDHGGTGVEYQGVGRDITEQKGAEAKIRQYIADREFLMQTAMELMDMGDDENLYQYIANQVHALIPDQITAVAPISQSGRTITLQYIAGIDAAVVKEFRDLGVYLIGKSFSLDKDPAVEAILKMKCLTQGPPLYNLLFREFPREVCTHLENRMGFGKNYVMGFTHEGKIFGSVVIILRPGYELKNKEIIELFLNQVSVALLHAHARQELKKSEALYRSVIENIQDVFYRSDAAGNLVMASPSWAKMLGYDSLDDCVGYNIAEKFYADPARRKEFLDAVYRDGSVSDYEVVLKCSDGTPLYVSTSSHLYYDNAGSSPGVEGIFRDISERHRASEKIRNHISQMDLFSIKLQEFIELSPDADIFEKIASDLKLLVTDAMISVNSFNNVTGILTCRSCKGEEDHAACTHHLGRNPEDIPFPVDPPVLQILSTGRLHKVTLSLYDMLFRVIPRKTCDHIVEAVGIGDTYAIGFVRGDTLFGNATIFLHNGATIPDIQLIETYARAASIALQREIAENALTRSEEIFSSVAENAPVPIAIIEPDATYQYVNKKFIETFGYDLDDFRTGSEWFSLAYPDPEYRKKVIATWKSDVKESGSGIVRPRTFTVRCKDGADREILFRPVTLSDGKECIVYEDVTKQHAAGEIQKLLR